MEEEKQERSFELRSEKVRSIVGQIPPSLVRYGITVIGIVLLCLLAVAYFLPYKQVYSGTAIVHGAAGTMRGDSLDIAISLRFDNKRPHDASGQMIYMNASKCTFAGCVVDLSAIRDTLDYQRTVCRFKVADIQTVENQTVNFQIVQSSGNLLLQMLGGT
ncbi:MAG TPA: hypothetical protein DIS88_03785 [Prevotella sp.]|nr:hypothetical protein [Prevotella sp.]